MEFIEAPAFTRHVQDYLEDVEYLKLQLALARNPALGDVMPGTGGFRKLRWGEASRGKGKRGGLRIIYYRFAAENQIWLLTLYSKGEAADLTAKEKQALKGAIIAELRVREAKKPRPQKPPRRRD